MRTNLNQRIVLGVGASFTLGAVVALLTYSQLTQNQRASTETRRMASLITHIDSITSLLKDAETGQRGYLITQGVEYLEPYNDALASLPGAFTSIRAMVHDEPPENDLLPRIDALQRLAFARLDMAQHVLDRSRSNPEDAVDLLREGRGKELMDQVRRMSAELRGSASTLLEDRSRIYQRSGRTLALSIFGGITLLVLFNGLLGRMLVQDLRRREHTEGALRDADARHRSIVMSIGDGLMTTDNRARIAFMNPVAERLMGITAGEALGKSAFELLNPRDQSTSTPLPDPFTSVLTGGQRSVAPTVTTIGLHGRALTVEFTCSPITDAEGQTIGSVLSFRDVSDRVNIEREREALLASERAARSDAERASRLKDEFVATLSHELRTPLNAIMGWTQILRRSGVDAFTTAQGLEIIERNTRVQTALVSDLLDVSRMMSGKLRLEVQSCDLPEIVRDAVASVSPTADAKGVRLTQIIDEHAGPVTGDPARLQQVIWNLLSNAIKFTPKGGKVSVRLRKIESHVEIEVGDSGEGIAPEFLPHVFERFRQADATTTRTHGGLGLGLSIARQLVELHGGRISAESSGKGQGSVFTVHLPMIAVQQGKSSDGVVRAPSRAYEQAGPGIVPPSLAGIDILVVDDEPDARSLLERVLRDRSARVRTAESVERALLLLGEHVPDVLISDLGMPVQDGFQLIKKVRSLPHEAGGDLPAIALTAFARTADRTRSLLAGFQAHLTKPVDATELIATVASLARNHNARNEHGQH